MSLRFFRKKAKDKDTAEEKKSASAEADKKKSASAETSEKKNASTEEQKKPSRGRGQRSGASSASKPNEPASERATSSRSSTTKKPAEAETSSSSSSGQKSSNGRRRGRRGGAGRKSTAAKADESKTSAKAPTADPGSLESIMSAQQAALQELAAQQVSTLKGLQGSLSAIENRLTNSGTERSSALADRPRIGIFVDVPNIMYAAERERVTLDFGRVLNFIIGSRELVRASAYAPISDDPEEELETQKFVQPFTDLGYRIVTKPLKRYSNGTIKANFDVELAIDVLTMSDRLDIVVLLSGDGDFRRLVEIVASKGVRVEVVAFGNSTAAELRAVADTYTDLNDHLKELRVKR